MRQDVDQLLDRCAHASTAGTAPHGPEGEEALHVHRPPDHWQMPAVGTTGVLEQHLVRGADAQAPGVGDTQDVLSFRKGRRERPLDLHVRASFQAGDRQGRVGRGWCDDVHDVRPDDLEHLQRIREEFGLCAEPLAQLRWRECWIDDFDPPCDLTVTNGRGALGSHLSAT